MSKTNVVSFKPSDKNQRNRPQKNLFILIGTIIILVITVVAFVLSPIISALAGGGVDAVFGKWNRDKIEYVSGNYFTNMIQRVNDEYSDNPISENEDEQRQFVWRQAFNQTVLHLAMQSYLDHDKIEITDDMIDEVIINYSIFQDSSGNFSPRLYNELSTVEKQDLRESIEESLSDSVFTSLQFSQLQNSDAEKDFILDMADLERKINFAVLNTNLYPDEEAAAYAADNSALFDRYPVSRILYEGEEDEIQQIIDRINAGEISFSEAAATYSTDSFAENGGEMGTLYGYQLKNELSSDEDFDDFIQLDAGVPSRPFQAANGWAIYLLRDAVETADVTDETVIAAAKSYISAYESGTVQDYLNNLAETLATETTGENFIEVCEANGITAETSEFFPLNYGDLSFMPTVSTASENALFSAQDFFGNYTLSRNQDFFKAVFNGPVGALADPVTIGQSVVLIQPIEEQTNERSETIAEYYEYLVNQTLVEYKQDILNTAILDSDSLQDNFYETYRRVFPES